MKVKITREKINSIKAYGIEKSIFFENDLFTRLYNTNNDSQVEE